MCIKCDNLDSLKSFDIADDMLLKAVKYGFYDIVEYLVLTSNFVFKLETKTHALINAFAQDRNDIVELFMFVGGFSLIDPIYGAKYSLHYAVMYGVYDVVKALLEEIGSPTVYNIGMLSENLALAAKLNRRNIVNLFLNAGVNPNYSDQDGYYPLHHAVMNGYVDIAEDLVGIGGADCTISDNHGISPIHIAILSGNLDMVAACDPQQYELTDDELDVILSKEYVDILEYFMHSETILPLDFYDKLVTSSPFVISYVRDNTILFDTDMLVSAILANCDEDFANDFQFLMPEVGK